MKKIFLNLLKQPITNSYLSKINNRVIKKEFFYNLSVAYDNKTHLVSLSKPVNPKMQFTDKYAHRASQSITMLKSFKKISKNLKKRFKPKKTLEIGSNDGVFLKNFKKKEIIAVEPCLNLAKITKKKGYLTYPEFWTKKLSKKIFKKHNGLDLIYAANTICHIPNLREVFDAISISLDKNGVFVFEDPYIGAVLKMNSYDQFYDEHVHLFSLLSISKFTVKKKVTLLKKKEIKQGLNKFKTYKKFSLRVKKSKKELLTLLKKIKLKGKKVISYGASYKSATIFNYCNIGTELIEYATDTTKNKQGKFTPGKHIPIRSPNGEIEDNVDYAFLGAWNFVKEIKKKEKNFLKRGGKFISHVPNVKLIGL